MWHEILIETCAHLIAAVVEILPQAEDGGAVGAEVDPDLLDLLPEGGGAHGRGGRRRHRVAAPAHVATARTYTKKMKP